MDADGFMTLRDGDPVPAGLRGGVVAIGNFDGVHRGHRAVLDRAVDIARGRGAPALALTFEPHPRGFFRPERPVFRLTPSDVKARLIAATGFAAMVELTFDAALAAEPAEDFVTRILVARLAVAGAVVGHDFHFGKGRAGTPETLVALGRRHNFEVVIVPPAVAGDTPYSSSQARDHLAAGDLDAAAEVLGYRWFVRGAVVAGDKRGRDLGYPTANLRLADNVGLRHGVYAVSARVGGGELRPGVASFGVRPQFDHGAPLLEVHLFDFEGDLYGQTVEVAFVAFLRDEARFDSVEALIARMREDEAAARAVLAADPR